MKHLEPVLDGLLLLLSVALILRLYTAQHPPIVELATQQDAPHILHEPHAAEQLLPLRLSTVGGYITVEDLIRHLHEHPDLLTSDATTLLKEMEQTQQQILATEEEMQATELRLNQMALEIYDGLSEEEKFKIRHSRNIDSVNGVEAKYWRTLIESAESTP
jgi:hypothetical protein